MLEASHLALDTRTMQTEAPTMQPASNCRVELEQDDNYCGFKTCDPEGNVFEVYWEQ